MKSLARSRPCPCRLAVLAALGAFGCASSAGPGAEAPAAASAEDPTATSQLGADWRRATGEEGRFSLAWRPLGGELPRNREFDVEVVLREDGEPLAGARVGLRGWMPDHGHGLVRQPIVTDAGGGRYLVEGLLLHMRGTWQLFFDVRVGSARDVVAFEFELG